MIASKENREVLNFPYASALRKRGITTIYAVNVHIQIKADPFYLESAGTSKIYDFQCYLEGLRKPLIVGHTPLQTVSCHQL
jgi:hypothetical protein